MSGPTDFDIDVLRCLNGEDVPDLRWGAAMGVAVEYLRGAGYAAGYGRVEITEKGRAYLEALDSEGSA